jgi:hypothetical protein
MRDHHLHVMSTCECRGRGLLAQASGCHPQGDLGTGSVGPLAPTLSRPSPARTHTADQSKTCILYDRHTVCAPDMFVCDCVCEFGLFVCVFLPVHQTEGSWWLWAIAQLLCACMCACLRVCMYVSVCMRLSVCQTGDL